MRLEERTKELIAVGASVTANCQPCLNYHVSKASESGAEDDEITEAISVARMVRKGAVAEMDKFASGIFQSAVALNAAAEGCGSEGCGERAGAARQARSLLRGDACPRWAERECPRPSPRGILRADEPDRCDAAVAQLASRVGPPGGCQTCGLPLRGHGPASRPLGYTSRWRKSSGGAVMTADGRDRSLRSPGVASHTGCHRSRR